MMDKDLIKELRNGNTGVMKQLYGHLNKVVNYVLKNSGTVEDAHDLFQDALIIFYKNVLKPDFELISSIGTYLYSICTRLWLKKLRDNKMDLIGIESGNLSSDVENSDFGLKENKKPNLTYELEFALKNIGEPCNTILESFYFKKLSLDQIAKKMKYSSSQVVRQQKYRCLKRIKDKIGAVNFQ